MYNILFVCFAWGFSAITAAIATRIRGNPTENDAWLQLQQSGYDCGTQSPAQCLQQAIFEGYFLEAGPTIIHAVFFALGAGILIWIKAKYKQYIFSCVFGTICLTITMTYGPLFPYFNGTLGLVFVIPSTDLARLD